MKNFNQYCLNQQNFIAIEAIQQAIHAANDHFPEANLLPPSGIPPLNCWIYLETANPHYRSKFSLILNEAESRSGTRYPFAVVHCHKTHQNFTANPAWSLYQGQTPLATVTTPADEHQTNDDNRSIVLPCPTCGKEHRGPKAHCYYCHVVSQYERGRFRQHPYLERKQIPNDVAQTMGCRVFGGKLIIPLSGTQGYQVILPHGEKRYAVQNGLQDAHVTLGPIDPNGLIYLAEGVATAVSAHRATGQPTVAALDLNGLERNLKRLRHIYPQADIIILADNDVKPGRVENPGLDKAFELSRKYGCKITVPKTSYKADFNDLQQTHGLETVKTQIEAAIQIKAEPTAWAKAVAEAVPQGELVHLNYGHLIDGQYLSHDLLTPYLTDEQTLIFIKSPMGTGKTRAVLKPVKAFSDAKNLTFGYSAPLQNLVRNACGVLDITPHVDFDELDKLKDKPQLGFCTNGFTNKSWQPSKDKDSFDILVLDEIEQQQQANVNGTVKDKVAVFNAMHHQIGQANKAIIMDADLSVQTIQRITQGYKGRVVIIENPAPNWEGRNMVLADTPQLVNQAHQTLLNGGKVLIACASKKIARGLSRKLGQAHPTKTINLITQDTAQQHLDFINEPNSYLAANQPDCIIHTSVIGSGFSIDVKGYFDRCLLFGGRNLTVDALFQLIGRYRHWSTFSCDIPEVGLYRQDATWEDFHDEVLKLAELELKQGEYIDLSHYKLDREHPFYDLVADVNFAENESRRELRSNFIKKATALGATIRTVGPSSWQERKETRQAIRGALQEYEEAQAKRAVELHQSNPMSEQEAERYEISRIVRGGDDYLRFRAFDYERFYCEPVNIQGLIADYYGDGQKKIERYERILLNQLAIEQLAKQNLESAQTDGEKLDATQVKGIAIHYKLTRKLLATLGFTFDEEGLLNADNVARFSRVELINHTEFMAFVDEHQAEINQGGLGFTVTQNTQKSPIRFVSLILRSIGIQLETRRSGPKRYRVVDLAELEKLNATVKRRRARAELESNASVESGKEKGFTQYEVTRISHIETIEGVIYAFDEAGNGKIIGSDPPD